MVRAKDRVRSTRYRTLESELRLLRRQLLPAQFSPTGSYRPRVHTLTFAYRVLVHSEIEAYIEDRVRQVYTTAVAAHQASGKVTTVVASMLAFSGLTLEQPPKTFGADPERVRLMNKIGRAKNSFEYLIKNNNGVKEANLCDLLLPVGINPVDLDPVWVNEMESFGRDRGLIAHTTAGSYRATHLPDPRLELGRTTRLLVGLKQVDELLNNLLA